jgi:ribonuclease R
MFMLRAMAQASYSTDNLGHFALASPAYVHFTSPIRRYPDLVAHRVLKAHLKRSGGQAGPEPVPEMPELEASQAQAARSSSRERATADAERDSKALFAAAYMRDRIGDRFEATITGFGSAGMYILLDRPFVDGMIRLGRSSGSAASSTSSRRTACAWSASARGTC